MQALFGFRQRPSVDLVGPRGIALERLDTDASSGTADAAAAAAAAVVDARRLSRSSPQTRGGPARQPSLVPAVRVVADFLPDVTAADTARGTYLKPTLCRSSFFPSICYEDATRKLR